MLWSVGPQTDAHGCASEPTDAVLSRSVVSGSLRHHGQYPASLLCPRGFSRQESWSRLLCPPPGDLHNPGVKPRPPTLLANSLLSEPPGKVHEFNDFWWLGRVWMRMGQSICGNLVHPAQFCWEAKTALQMSILKMHTQRTEVLNLYYISEPPSGLKTIDC